VLEEASYRDAIAAAAGRLTRILESKGPGAIAGIASPHATNEDLFTFRRFLDALGVEAMGVPVVPGEGDAILVTNERAANGAGARALGFGDPENVVERIREGAVDAIVALGHDVIHPLFLGETAALDRLETIVLLDSHVSAIERAAHVILPTRLPAEKLGTLTNCEGRVQRVEPAVEPAWEALAEGEAIARLGAALGLPGFDGSWDARRVSAEMASSVPAFAGCDVESVGPGGRPVGLEGASS
jgi:predicted molibdopterin-dependent oxidoreductase YjgC